MGEGCYVMLRRVPAEFLALLFCMVAGVACAQVAPATGEIAGYTGLLAAAARGDAPGIGRLIATQADVNARDAYGRTPLQLARSRGYAAMVEILEKAGAK